MMTPPAGDTGIAPDPPPPETMDDMSVNMAPSGIVSPQKERKLTEYVIRFTHSSKDANAVTIFANLHAILLHALLEAHGSSICIYSKSNVWIEQVPIAEWAAKMTHAKHFTIHQYKMKDSSIKHVIQHCIYSLDTFAKLKCPIEVMKILNENKIRMLSHKWTEDVADTAQPIYKLVPHWQHGRYGEKHGSCGVVRTDL